MNEAGVDVLLVVGNNHASGSPLFSTGSFRYLTDFFIFSLCGLFAFLSRRRTRDARPNGITGDNGKKIFLD